MRIVVIMRIKMKIYRGKLYTRPFKNFDSNIYIRCHS